MEAKTRASYSTSERIALRRQHRQAPLLSQKQLAEWFTRVYKKPIKQTTVSNIIGKRYAHLDEPGTIHNPSQKRESTRDWPDLEQALAQWHAIAQPTLPVTGDLIRQVATDLWHKLPQYQDLPVPVWSTGWVCNFKSRYNIRERRRHGESGSVKDSDLMASISEVQAQLSLYSAEDQYNCDETGLFWKALPERSLTSHALPGLKHNKQRITLLNCVNKTGSHKLPLWIIGKYKNPRCFNAAGVNIQRLNCTYEANKKAWMTGPIFL